MLCMQDTSVNNVCHMYSNHLLLLHYNAAIFKKKDFRLRYPKIYPKIYRKNYPISSEPSEKPA